MKGIRFKPDCIKWIKSGIKTTTFRNTRRNGVYEIIEGSWFHPKGLGVFIRCTPIRLRDAKEVIKDHYHTEGDFNSPNDFILWLDKNALSLPSEGWLNKVEYIKELSEEKQNA